ncbi:MAG: radical SAM protein, partial [Candidatus Omnitrophica bacterium]|nr:radical SAM protein [Candidatus Omnitrophota bacterium]
MLKIRLLNRLFNGKELWALRHSFARIGRRLFNVPRIYNLIALYVSRWGFSAQVSGVPYLAMLEPTSRCNLRCPMCGRTFAGLNRAERDMSLAEFNVVFNKIKSNLLAVGFWNLGEPLLNGSLFEMVRVAAREDIFSIVLTNGTLLDQRKSQEVIASGLDYLGISMDGASASSYNKYRLGGDFKTVVGNIKFLIEEKKRRRSLTPFVEIIFLVMKDNEREIEAMIKLAGDLGVNKLSLKKVSLGFADEFIEPAEFLPAERRYIHSIH